MGQISTEILGLTGSALSGNQQRSFCALFCFVFPKCRNLGVQAWMRFFTAKVKKRA